jgi:PadR family transcriptional regulator PadR
LGEAISELTKFEEQILLSVWNLQENAYGISIDNHIRRISGKKLAIGGIYFPLERLVEKGFLKARQGEPTPVRGGQSKRFYTLTKQGYRELLESRKTHEAFWKDLPRLSFMKEEEN